MRKLKLEAANQNLTKMKPVKYLKGQNVAKASPESNEPELEAASSIGKGRPTPSRQEQEAARKRPLVADTKEARAKARAEMADKREAARVGMANGEERYLPERDKGAQRRWLRDWVDSQWFISEWVMAIMVLVIVLTFIPVQFLQFATFPILLGFMFFVLAEMFFTGARAKKAVSKKFGASRLQRGTGYYAAMRSMQMRFMRLPKPQVRRGQRPE